MQHARQEAIKISPNEQKHFTQRCKVANDAKKTNRFVVASLSALASLREIVCLFTDSQTVARRGGRGPIRRGRRGKAAPESSRLLRRTQEVRHDGTAVHEARITEDHRRSQVAWHIASQIMVLVAPPGTCPNLAGRAAHAGLKPGATVETPRIKHHKLRRAAQAGARGCPQLFYSTIRL